MKWKQREGSFVKQRWQSVLRKKPLGLVFDIDGTLSPIAPTPSEARLFPGVASLLDQARQYAQVAIMTGRAIGDGAKMVNIEGITYIGSHGLEWSDGLPESHQIHIVPEAMAYIEPSRRVLDQAEQLFAGMPGILVERKQIGGAIHYRLAPDPEWARLTILERMAEPIQETSMRLSEGKRVIEVKTLLNVNKGQALRTFAERLDLQAILFAGDDRTDLDALLEIEQLRQRGLEGVAVVVQHADTLPELLEHADIVVQGVEGMVNLLTEIVQELGEKTKGR